MRPVKNTVQVEQRQGMEYLCDCEPLVDLIRVIRNPQTEFISGSSFELYKWSENKLTYISSTHRRRGWEHYESR